MSAWCLTPLRLLVLFLSVFCSLAQPLVNHGDTWFYRKGLSAPQANWKTLPDGSLDPSWLSGNGGFGYANNTAETSLCQTLLNDMRGSYGTVEMRKTFQISTPVDPTLHLLLTMDWDDGFIAWLDGVYLASANSPGSPSEPAFNASSTAGHESSRGDSSPEPAVIYDLGPVGARLAVGSHVLAIVGLNSSLGSSGDFVQIADLALGPPPSSNCVSGTLAVDTTWSLANSPIQVCGKVTIASGATLRIDPGVVVELNQGIGLEVANGGRVVAEGTETNHVHFTRAPGATAWGGITINGGAGSPETRIAYADFEFNSATAIHSAGGTVFLDHLTFAAHDHQYISLDSSSFIVSHCTFPKATAAFEPVHGTGGIKSGGHGVFLRNFFGGTVGYNDVTDFTGGNRPGPIVHFINNVISGGQDDGLDLDGTDAWVEGNIFVHLHRNGDTPDSSGAVSGGNSGNDVSDITITGNLFFDCDNAATAKQGNFFSLINNTIVHTTKAGGIDGDSGVVNVRDTTPSPTTFGKGYYMGGNIVVDAGQLVRNYDPAHSSVTCVNTIIPMHWTGPGQDNRVTDPKLKHIPTVSEASFSTWAEAQVLRDWFSLQTNSPALGTGPNNHDLGGVIPIGVFISGEPSALTSQSNATLVVGFNRTGSGIPASGWPSGAGYTHYKWRLDGGTWSAETAISEPITLTSLADGTHYVEVTGRRDSGLYQDDPVFGADAVVSRSRSWTVQTQTRLHFDSVSHAGSITKLVFEALPGQAYTLLVRDAFDTTHPWSKLQDIPVQTTAAAVTLTDAAAAQTRYYLLTTAGSL